MPVVCMIDFIDQPHHLINMNTAVCNDRIIQLSAKKNSSLSVAEMTYEYNV